MSRTHVYGRTRLDIGLIIVCLVALLGGLSVFKSYADPAPIDLSLPGTSPLSKPFVSTSGATAKSPIYSLKTTQAMNYCFVGTSASEAKLTVDVSAQGSTKSFTEDLVADPATVTDLVCFEAQNSGVVKFQLHAQGLVKVSSITASKQSL